MGLLDQQVPYPGPDSGDLSLDVADLRAIAEAVEGLAGVRGLVPSIDVGQHRITLERHSDQRDGDWYTVVAITRAEVGR